MRIAHVRGADVSVHGAAVARVQGADVIVRAVSVARVQGADVIVRAVSVARAQGADADIQGEENEIIQGATVIGRDWKGDTSMVRPSRSPNLRYSILMFHKRFIFCFIF